MGMASITATSRKIEQFANLAVGWHYGQGGPVSPQQIKRAQKMLSFMLTLGFTRSEAFAGSDGDVLITAYHQLHTLDVTLEANGTASYTHEIDGVEHCARENIADMEARALLRIVSGEIWPTSALSTQGTTTPIEVSSTTWRSSVRLTAECRYLSKPVPNPQAA